MQKQKNIKKSLINDTIIRVLIPVYIVLILLIIVLFQTLVREVNDSYRLMFQQKAQHTNNIMEIAGYSMTSSVTRETLMDMLVNMQNPTLSTYEHHLQRVDIMHYLHELQLSTLTSFNGEIILLTESGEIFSATQIDKVNIDYLDESWYSQLKNSQFIFWDSQINNIFPMESSDNCIAFGHYVQLHNSDVNFMLLLRIPIKYIWEATQSDILEKGSIHLFSNDLRHLASSKEQYAHEQLQNIIDITNIMDAKVDDVRFGIYDNIYYFITKIDSSNNILVYTVDVVNAFEENINIILMIFLVMIVITVLVFMSTNQLANKLSKPITQLVDYMKIIEDDNFNISITNKTYEEIAKLEKSIIRANNRIKILLKQVYEETSEKEKMHFEALRAQINPHFLFNTLNAIRWKASLNNDTEISEIIQNLSLLLNQTYNGQEKITIKETVQILTAYTKIMQVRYQNNFEFICLIPNELMEYKIPVFSLQPLIENSIIHGLCNMDSGLILLKAKFVGDDIELCVTDNGQGFKKNEASLLDNDIEQQKSSSKLTGIGIANIHRRVQLIYGEKYGLHIDNTVTMGSRIILLIPKEKESENT